MATTHHTEGTDRMPRSTTWVYADAITLDGDHLAIETADGLVMVMLQGGASGVLTTYSGHECEGCECETSHPIVNGRCPDCVEPVCAYCRSNDPAFTVTDRADGIETITTWCRDCVGKVPDTTSHVEPYGHHRNDAADVETAAMLTPEGRSAVSLARCTGSVAVTVTDGDRSATAERVGVSIFRAEGVDDGGPIMRGH